MNDQQNYRRKPGIVVIQVLAIILLVIAVISSAFYFVVHNSLKQAEEYNAVPTVMGKIYLPITSDNFSDIARNGSLVIGQPMTVDGMSEGEVAIYALPDGSTDNVVYKSFGMGYIQSITEQNGDVVLNIQTSEGSVAVVSTLVRGRAEQQVFLFGNAVNAVEQPMGLFGFVVAPVFLFVVLQLLVVIFRTLAGRSERMELEDEEDEYDGLEFEDDDFEEEDETDAEDGTFLKRSKSSKRNKKKGLRFHLLEEVDEEDDDDDEEIDFEEQKPKKPAPRKVTQIKSQTVSTIKGEYGLKNDKQKKELLKPYLPQEEQQSVEHVQPEAAYVKPPAPPKNSVNAESKPEAKSTEQPSKPKEPLTKIFDAAFTDDEEYERRLMSEHTMEFDMEALKEKMRREEPDASQNLSSSESQTDLTDNYSQDLEEALKQFDPQEILNQIMIEVKQEALDFNFQNLQKDGVNVEKNCSGDGFVISTPNYKANIKVELDKE